ncbi:MAG: hypothetical protein CMI53_03580 [Parcubacteria group bacterium]|jgi:hypothetical protein|nr:hypothetical protein [Parcubacteria group bacterium]|tara:strand:- start:8637 stop:8864 length:228 start_codon:yes stop_codon:yes gene_type:complete
MLLESFAEGKVKIGAHIALVASLVTKFSRPELADLEVTAVEPKMVTVKTLTGQVFTIGQNSGSCGWGMKDFSLCH